MREGERGRARYPLAGARCFRSVCAMREARSEVIEARSKVRGDAERDNEGATQFRQKRAALSISGVARHATKARRCDRTLCVVCFINFINLFSFFVIFQGAGGDFSVFAWGKVVLRILIT